VDYVMYWTGITRWESVYTDSHNFAHSMTLLLMTITIYVTLRPATHVQRRGMARHFERIALGVVSLSALHGLYMSQVRSAVLGLITFGAVYLYSYNRRLLVVGA